MTTLEGIFAQGFGKVKIYKVVDFGFTTEYIKNQNMSQSQLKKAPTFVIEATAEMRLQAARNKEIYEAKSKTITILEFAQKVAKANNGKITHKSKSGSVYLTISGKTVRISDHTILDRDSLNPVVRHDFEIVQKYFTENDNAILNLI